MDGENKPQEIMANIEISANYNIQSDAMAWISAIAIA